MTKKIYHLIFNLLKLDFYADFFLNFKGKKIFFLYTMHFCYTKDYVFKTFFICFAQFSWYIHQSSNLRILVFFFFKFFEVSIIMYLLMADLYPYMSKEYFFKTFIQ